jgi:parallel beta-helix repeat protein
VIRNTRIAGNQIGIFFCWGVRQGLAEGNQVSGNGTGISIGHHDTDNLVRDNEISGSKTAGVLFRPERGPAFTGDRNRIEHNRLVDNGAAGGFAVDIQGGTRSIDLAGNEIVETRGAGERTAIRVGPQTQDVRLDNNHIEGFAHELAK